MVSHFHVEAWSSSFSSSSSSGCSQLHLNLVQARRLEKRLFKACWQCLPPLVELDDKLHASTRSFLFTQTLPKAPPTTHPPKTNYLPQLYTSAHNPRARQIWGFSFSYSAFFREKKKRGVRGRVCPMRLEEEEEENEAIQLERRGLGRGSPRRSELDTADKSASWLLMGFLFWSWIMPSVCLASFCHFLKGLNSTLLCGLWWVFFSERTRHTKRGLTWLFRPRMED